MGSSTSCNSTSCTHSHSPGRRPGQRAATLPGGHNGAPDRAVAEHVHDEPRVATGQIEEAAALGKIHVCCRIGVRTLEHRQFDDVQPEAREPLLGGSHRKLWPLARGRRRHHVGRARASVLDEQAVVLFVARLELVATDQRQEARCQPIARIRLRISY